MKMYFIKIRFFLKNSIKLYCIGFLTILLYTVTILLSPIASGYLIDNVLEAKNINDIKSGVLFFFIATMSQPLIGFIKDLIFNKLVLDIYMNISQKIFDSVIHATMDFFDKSKRGEIISKLTNDTKIVSEFVSKFFSTLIKNILLIILIIVAMLSISWKITLIVLSLFIAFFTLSNKLDSNLENISKEIAHNNDTIYSKIEQMLAIINTIKNNSIEKYIIHSHNESLLNQYNITKKRNILILLINNISIFFTLISLSIIYLLGCIDIINNKLSVGLLITLGLLFQILIQPFYEIVNGIIDFKNTKPILNRIYEFCNLEQEVIKKNNIKDITQEWLKIKNLKFNYNSNKCVLENINMNFPNNGLIGIMGESGSGKSTLIKLLLKYYIPTSGEIFLYGKKYNDIGIEARNCFAVVPQDVMLLNMSIIENFLVANTGISETSIVDYCKKVNLHEKIISLDSGYNSIINEKCNLSGGERQRLGIAIALSKNCNIVLLDEPTSALDSVNENIIVELLKSESQDKLVIIITHRKSTLKDANIIYKLDKGKIIGGGLWNT